MSASSTTVRVAGLTDVGLEREKNDDSFIVADLNPDVAPCSGCLECRSDGVLLAVADGMGGHAHGEIASMIAICELSNAMKRLSGRSPDRVRRAVEHAHRSVREAAAGRTGFARMGTTLTAVHIDGKRAHIAHVGDSRAYVVRGGKISRLTVDQTMTEIMIEAGIIDESERRHSPWRPAVTSSISRTSAAVTTTPRSSSRACAGAFRIPLRTSPSPRHTTSFRRSTRQRWSARSRASEAGGRFAGARRPGRCRFRRGRPRTRSAGDRRARR